MATIAERVAAGAAFLDEHDPDWWRSDVERAIDLHGLSLGSVHDCILGQRCPLEVLAKVDPKDDEEGPFWAYALVLTGMDSEDTVLEWATGYGFADIPSLRYLDLTAEWKRVITARREASDEA